MGRAGGDLVEARFFGRFSADDDDGEVIEGVAVAFSKLVDPDDGGVVEHVAVATCFRSLAQTPGEVGELLGEPEVDFFELALGVLVFIRFVAQRVVSFLNIEPAHAGLPDRAHELEGADAREIVGHGIDEEVHLHPGKLWRVVIDQFDVGIEFRFGMRGRFLVIGGRHFFFEITNQGEVLVEEGAVFRRKPA